MCTVAAASGAASVRVWHITSRGWDPWTERPLPEVVRVAIHNHFLLRTDANGSQTLVGTGTCGPDVLEDFEACDRGVPAFRKLPGFGYSRDGVTGA